MTDVATLGPCCVCGGEEGVTSIVMLPFKAVVPGHGWGCVVCGLAADGASAVLCDRCAPGYLDGLLPLRFVCRGYPASEGRLAIGDFASEPHEHDDAAHVAAELGG